MKQKRLFIGTSGWNYDHWKGAFYPEDSKSPEWFEYYSKRLQTVEINNSFYNLPELSTIKKWYRSAPDGFLFSVKASRYITHMKKLKDPRKPLIKMMRRVGPLKEKLGPVLFQLPPRWKCNTERLKSFLDTLPGKSRFAMEFRDDSWWNKDVYKLLEKYGVAYCIFDLNGQTSPREVTTDLVYIRLHGPKGAYQGKYDSKELAGWAGAISSWRRQGKKVYCYFDNDDNGYAPQNALALREMLN